MNFGGHLLASWLLANATRQYSGAERRTITLIGISPDIDGIFTFIPNLGHLHRTFGHNLWFLIVVPVVATFLFISPLRRLRLYPVMLLSLLLHYLLDIFVTGWWPFIPLWPFSQSAFYMDRYIAHHIMEYYIQIGLFLTLLIPTVLIFLDYQRTPMAVISGGFDSFIQDFLLLPWSHSCHYCRNRAFYRCSECGRLICGKHRCFGTRFSPLCSPQCLSSARVKN